jgi:hypothetical protein
MIFMISLLEKLAMKEDLPDKSPAYFRYPERDPYGGFFKTGEVDTMNVDSRDDAFWQNVFEQVAEDVSESDWEPVKELLKQLPTEAVLNYLTRGE